MLLLERLEGQGWEVLMLLDRLAHDEGTLREHPTRGGKADEGRPFCPRGNPRQLCERGRWLGPYRCAQIYSETFALCS